MTDQLALFAAPAKAARTDLPAPVAEIVAAAQSLSFTTRIVRGCWGVGVGPKKKYALTGAGCCCALGALLVVSGEPAEKEDRSVACAVARHFGVLDGDVFSFVRGYDGRLPDDGSLWFGYGRLVAEELGVADAP